MSSGRFCHTCLPSSSSPPRAVRVPAEVLCARARCCRRGENAKVAFQNREGLKKIKYPTQTWRRKKRVLGVRGGQRTKQKPKKKQKQKKKASAAPPFVTGHWHTPSSLSPSLERAFLFWLIRVLFFLGYIFVW